jgi:excisionase family DNA binding protein
MGLVREEICGKLELGLEHGFAGQVRVVSRAEEITEAYRVAEQRLRRLLLGDGELEPGIVKGEEARTRVTTSLRHMRESFAEALEDGDGRAAAAETRATELQEELLEAAARAAAPRPEDEVLLTPAQVAEELNVRVDAVYRAVRRNEIAVLRTRQGRRDALRIPASEVGRLRESQR